MTRPPEKARDQLQGAEASGRDPVLTFLICLGILWAPFARAQPEPSLQAQSQRFFPPLGSGDGVRDTLVLSPVVWEILGQVKA